ncbi:MAG: hypothetical protein F6K24_26090 [Okeania sp. SIO2D1]|nr:hypothetical protein [Okeania sp. SIO2D1]
MCNWDNYYYIKSGSIGVIRWGDGEMGRWGDGEMGGEKVWIELYQFEKRMLQKGRSCSDMLKNS